MLPDPGHAPDLLEFLEGTLAQQEALGGGPDNESRAKLEGLRQALQASQAAAVGQVQGHQGVVELREEQALQALEQ